MSDTNPPASTVKNKAFKPRANVVRKTKAERDAHAKEEAEKAAVRAAAAAQAEAKAAHVGKSNSSKRKEVPKDNKDSQRSTGGGGVFGAGTGTRQAWKRSTVDGGRNEMLEGQDAVNPVETLKLQGQDEEVKSRGKKPRTKASASAKANANFNTNSRDFRFMDDIGPYGTDEESDGSSGRDLDGIEIGNDDDAMEDSATKSKGKARAVDKSRKIKQSTSLRPVRAPRIVPIWQHAEDEQRAAKPSLLVGDEPEVQEDMDDMELDDDDHLAGQTRIKQDLSSSPELSRRTKPGKRLGPRGKDGKLVIETVEEKEERLRLFEDVIKLRREFVPSTEAETNEDIEVDGIDDRPEGKYFLLQFPPLIPFLQDQATASSAGQDSKHQVAQSGPTIKPDPDGPKQPATVVAENDTGSGPALPKDGMLTANEPARLPPGRVGKLRVHRSGKVTLDWGGTDMEVRYGTEVDFLQDVVLVETPAETRDDDDQAPKPQTGTTYALGQVQKKLVVIPNWQRLYD